jgi:hypothetical protein
VAIKARKVTFAHRRMLLQSLLRRIRQQPREFLLPPKAGIDESGDVAEPTSRM